MEPSLRTAEPRRVRQRRVLVDDICDEARRQLEAGGAGAVSWRGIARAVGMSPASLYTYFESLDALFTELLLRSYSSLAAAVAEALDAFSRAPVGDRLLVGPLAYRRWALTHRGEFNLIFTDQLPGYAAAPGGPTVDAQVAVFGPMVATISEAVGTPPADSDLVGLWGTFHGLTSLEVNHHLDWVDAGEVFEREVRARLAAQGLPTAAHDLTSRFAAWVP
ncbi:MAG: TetR/AcrR family transcriptional regulator [Ilumatobacteraceae bacterium]|jgi:AcrR family transcriptional regulator|nr:TetR/AcrR family transcriptional regulator [Ilumatobacteraceae bacterium]